MSRKKLRGMKTIEKQKENKKKNILTDREDRNTEDRKT